MMPYIVSDVKGMKVLSSCSVLSTARTHAGLSQRELASRCGTSAARISNVETAKSEMTLPALARAVEACGLHLELTLRDPDGFVPSTADVLEEQLFLINLGLTPEERVEKLEKKMALRGLLYR
jgi:transcriptional regulator with XRE-family HTH domain